jgi:hypothetical protein
VTNVDKALLLSEWAGVHGVDADACCPCCEAYVCTGKRHEPNCPMDLALSERGYCVQEERERARDHIFRGEAATAPTLPPSGEDR